MAALKALPLSTPEIRGLLEEAERPLERGGARRPAGSPGRRRARRSTRRARRCSRLFEQLTDRYERSMQVLMG